MLAAGVKFDDEQEDQDGSQGVARAGPGGGCAKAPLAGLPPHAPPSLTQSAAEVAPTGATATRAGSSACLFVSGQYPFGCKWTLSFAEPVVSCGAIRFVHIDQQSSSTSR